MRTQGIKARGRSVGRGQRAPWAIDASGTAWMTEGNCAKAPGRADEWFAGFGGDNGTGTQASSAVSERSAKALCAGCPIVERCLLYAVGEQIPHGVWGGKTPDWRTRNGARLLAREETA